METTDDLLRGLSDAALVALAGALGSQSKTAEGARNFLAQKPPRIVREELERTGEAPAPPPPPPGRPVAAVRTVRVKLNRDVEFMHNRMYRAVAFEWCALPAPAAAHLLDWLRSNGRAHYVEQVD